MINDQDANEVFNIMVLINVSDGDKKLLWRDRWIRSMAVKDVAPINVRTYDLSRKPCRGIVGLETSHEICCPRGLLPVSGGAGRHQNVL
jgi:hypothetical protein